MKNRFKDYFEDDENKKPEEQKKNPDDFMNIISEILNNISNHLAFSGENNNAVQKKYGEEIAKLIDGLPEHICKHCGNPYHIMGHGIVKTTLHPTGFACHWCNHALAMSYYNELVYRRGGLKRLYDEEPIYS